MPTEYVAAVITISSVLDGQAEGFVILNLLILAAYVCCGGLHGHDHANIDPSFQHCAQSEHLLAEDTISDLKPEGYTTNC